MLPLRRTPTGYDATVINTASYAGIVHGGRGPVVAKRAKALRFRIGNRIIFARRVRGARAQPWMRDALIYVANRNRFRMTDR